MWCIHEYVLIDKYYYKRIWQCKHCRKRKTTHSRYNAGSDGNWCNDEYEKKNPTRIGWAGD